MGSKNYVSISRDSTNKLLIDWPIEKLFVDEYYQYVSSTDDLNTYNKDKYARVSYPFIEDETNNLSPYHSSNLES